MRRTVALLLVLAVLAGAMVYIHTKIWQMEDDVIFTENILAGDARWMEGETADIHYDAGAYLRWDCEYRFGETPSVQTVFHLSQMQPQDQMGLSNSEFYIDPYASRTTFLAYPLKGDPQTGNRAFDQMILDAATQTPTGETQEFDFTTTDYLEDYPYDIYLKYQTPEKFCRFSTDVLLDHMEQDRPDTGFYRAFFEKFRFPVTETDSTRLSIYKGSDDLIEGIGIVQYEANGFGFLSAMGEDGLYLIPYFEDARGNPLKGDYSDGRGLYFIPWERYGESSSNVFDGEKWVPRYDVWPDLANSRNLFPIADDTHVCSLALSQDASTAWIVTWEDGGYYLDVLTVPDGTLRNRIFLMEQENKPTASSVVTENGYMVVAADQKLALVNLEGDCRLEFAVDSGAAQEHMTSLRFQTKPELRYEDGVLTLLNSGEYLNCYFYTAVFTADGLQFLANYTCNLDDRPLSGCLYFPEHTVNPATLR